MVTASVDSTVKIWDATDRSNWILIQTYRGHSSAVWGFEYIDTDTLATDSSDLTIQIWSISTGATLKTISVPMDLRSLLYISNKNYLASGHEHGNINIYDKNNGSLIVTLFGHSEWVYDLVYIRNMDFLASSGFSNDKNIRLWDMATFATKFILEGHENAVIGLKLIENYILASSSEDQTIKLWNINDGTLIRTLSGHTHSILWGIDKYNSQILLSGSLDQTIKVWDYNTGQLLNTISTQLEASSLLVLNTTYLSKSFCRL